MDHYTKISNGKGSEEIDYTAVLRVTDMELA
jgi:hypothetical protein